MLRNSILSFTMIGALAAAMFNTPENKGDARSSELVHASTLVQAPADLKEEMMKEMKAEDASGESMLEKPAEVTAAESHGDHEANHGHSDHGQMMKETKAEDASGESVLEKPAEETAAESHGEHDANHAHDHADNDHADHDHSGHDHAYADHSHGHYGDVTSLPVEAAPCCSCYTVCEARRVRVGLFKLRCKTCLVPVTVCDSCPIHAPMMAAPVIYLSLIHI